MKVTEVEPPHAEGAPVLLLLNTPLQPPDTICAVAKKVANVWSTAVCVWQAGVVVLAGHNNEAPEVTDQLKVRVQVFDPHSPVATYVKTCSLLQPFEIIGPAVQTTVAGPHSLVAVTVASQTGKVAGLHPRLVVPVVQLSKTGAEAIFQVKVRVQVEVKPQAVTEKVNTLLRLQPFDTMPPSEQVIPVTLPHSLLAVTAPPNGAVCTLAQVGMAPGLQPRSNVLSQFANTGAVVTCQLKIRWQVLKLPQAAAFAT